MLDRMGSRKRLHIVSEIVRNGHQLQIEEHLDLETWNQLIQFRWHQDVRGLGDEGLSIKKTNFLVLNNAESKQIIQYSPYICNSTPLDLKNNESADWRVELASSSTMDSDDLAISADTRYKQTISSIMFFAPNNPYLTKVEDTKSDSNVWVFGIAGAWLKAKYPGDRGQPPVQPPQMAHWTMTLVDAEVQIDYHFDTELLMGASPSKKPINDSGIAKQDIICTIELKSSHSQSQIDLINIHDMDLNFSDQLASDLFKLPVGFNCPATAAESDKPLIYPMERNKLLELEIIATKLHGLQDNTLLSQTEIKTMSYATSPHPMDINSKLIMLHDHEDRFKVIHDYYHRIKYTIHYKTRKQPCLVDKLHFFPENYGKNEATDVLTVDFKNGINLILDDNIVNYLLAREDVEKQKPMNRIKSGEDTEELVFESELPLVYQRILSMTNGDLRYMVPQISLIRVFERSTAQLVGKRKFFKRGPLHLKRILLMVFDTTREKKFAEIRINLLETNERLSLQKRAKLFDLSRCYDLQHESMQLVATYPVETPVLDYAMSAKFDLVEYFYTQVTTGISITDSEVAPKSSGENQHLASSLNFLRIPKINILSSMTGDLELELTILDRLSLKYLLDIIPESTLSDRIVSEKFISQTVDECALMCQHFNCLMFSFASDISECKLSHEQYNDSDQSDQRVIELKRSSRVFYLRDLNQDLGASLYELLSYLEHSIGNEIEEASEDVDLDESSNRNKRDTKRPPVMSLMFLDKSKGEYALPEMKVLVPSKVKLLHMPIFFEVGDNSLSLRIKSAFETESEGKRYLLTALDNKQDVNNAPDKSDIRSFVDDANGVYYTGKLIKDISLDVCLNLCYDIDEWDSENSSEKLCTSLSYCSYEKECITIVKTDKDYIANIDDISSESNPVIKMDSLDLITRDGHGCLIAHRNRISDYDGPLRIPDYSRYTINPEFKVDLDYEWLNVFSIQTNTAQSSGINRCSDECYKWNKLGKICTGFDYCETVISEKSIIYKMDCYLMKLNVEREITQTSKFRTQLSELRNQMTQATKICPSSSEMKNATSSTKGKCYRYLTSNIREFTHLKQNGVSEFMLQHSKIGTPANENLNLDSCALQCLQDGSKCLAFEFCSSFNQELRRLVRSCKMIGGLRNSAPSLPTDEGDKTNGQQLTFYSENCHLYLRKEFKSMDDLYSFAQTSRPDPGEHKTLIIIFCIIYGSAVLITVLFVASKRKGLRLFGPLENTF